MMRQEMIAYIKRHLTYLHSEDLDSWSDIQVVDVYKCVYSSDELIRNIVSALTHFH